jgi:hypothetical protein
MLPDDHPARKLLSGRLVEGSFPWPLLLHVVLCDLRPRFLAKGQLGGGHRAVARNGRVLLASRLPLADLPGRTVQLRLQTWHKVILSGDAPEPHGLLLCVQPPAGPTPPPSHAARLHRPAGLPCSLTAEPATDLSLDVGGEMTLTFLRLRETIEIEES